MLSKEQMEEIVRLQSKLDSKIATTRKILENEEILLAKFLALFVEIGEFANEQRCFKYWSSKSASAKAVLLEEYIDGLHFIVSIANNLKINLTKLKIIEKEYKNLNQAFLDLYGATLKLSQKKNVSVINKWFNIYYTIGRLCNFTDDDIFKGYLEKNKINHLRQEQNY